MWFVLVRAAPPQISIALTEELYREIGRAACKGMIDMASGRRPSGIVNRVY
jgi:hypothetical protein